MAAGGGHGDVPLLNNPLFQDIEGRIAHILLQLGFKPKSDITEQLMNDVDSDTIVQCRDFVFGAAVALYDEQLEGHVESGKAKLELKNRRGERKS